MTVDAAPDPTCGCSTTGDTAFARECDYCGREFVSAHCIHADYQDPCPECDVLPVRQLVS